MTAWGKSRVLGSVSQWSRVRTRHVYVSFRILKVRHLTVMSVLLDRGIPGGSLPDKTSLNIFVCCVQVANKDLGPEARALCPVSTISGSGRTLWCIHNAGHYPRDNDGFEPPVRVNSFPGAICTVETNGQAPDQST